MPLKVAVMEKSIGVFTVSPAGSLDSNTHPVLEKQVDLLLSASPRAIIFDLKDLSYISSMGVRAVVRAKKALKKVNASFALVNVPPQIKKVFDIILALPAQEIFSSMEELDAYLARMQAGN